MLHADHRVGFGSPVVGCLVCGRLLALAGAHRSLLAMALMLAVCGFASGARAMGEPGGSSGPTLILDAPGPQVRAAGSTVVVDVRANGLVPAAVGMQLLVEWDAAELNFVSAAGGDGGFALLRAATVTAAGGAPGRMQLSMLTGVLDGSASIADGVLGRLTFTVPEGALLCEPANVLNFGPSGTVASTKLTAIGGTEIPFTGAEAVIVGTDTAAPSLVGVPDSVTLSPGATSSAELLEFTGASVTATDNCASVTPVRVITLPGGATVEDYPSVFPEGITTVSWTATDGSSNSSSAQRTVTVEPCPGPFATYYRDGDGDGFGVSGDTQVTCVGAPIGYAELGGDCDDMSGTAFPGAPELCATVGTDNNCNDVYDDVDADAPDNVTFFSDSDGDGYGDASVVVRACTAPEGFVAVAGDTCPGNGDLIAPVSYFVDGDGDSFGSSATASFCETSAPAGHSSTSGDCDDTNEAAFPGAPELCATVGTDNNCNDVYDDVDADAPDKVTFFSDTDGDGFGDAAVSVQACDAPAGFVMVVGDCDSDDPAVNPGAAETCNGIDDNCNGLADDGLEFRPYYLDADGDGYGDSATETSACAAPDADWVTDGGDNCPSDPAKLEPGDCGCGNPETDTDFDTVPDCVDNCPDAPNATQADCDGDGVGDACSTADDCNDNGVPDTCDIAGGQSADADGNGVPDSCQADCNGNGIPDSYEIADGVLADCNSNGVPDECEDGYVDSDTGNMGAVGTEQPVQSVLTGQVQASSDVHVQVDVRGDLDGINEYVVLTLNGISYGGNLFASGGQECPPEPSSASLTLSMFDWLDVMERATTAGEVRVRLVASADVSSAECSSGLTRVRVSYFGPGNDCDQDGQPDDCQLAAGQGDCNGNGIFDACERGTITDTDADGRPDSCERAFGDFNLDGIIDGVDLAFVLVAWSETTGGICDIDQDGDVDGNDLAYVLVRWGPVP